jgi:hypothetical protein
MGVFFSPSFTPSWVPSLKKRELAVTAAQNDRLAMSAEYRSWVAALIMPHAHPLPEFPYQSPPCADGQPF